MLESIQTQTVTLKGTFEKNNNLFLTSFIREYYQSVNTLRGVEGEDGDAYVLTRAPPRALPRAGLRHRYQAPVFGL